MTVCPATVRTSSPWTRSGGRSVAAVTTASWPGGGLQRAISCSAPSGPRTTRT
jgi:hypothetical protein